MNALVPIVAVTLGSGLGYNLNLSSNVQSVFRHLAIGVLLAALSAEFVPNMLKGSKTAGVIGFTIGALLMLGMRLIFKTSSGSPTELIGALSADFFVDAIMIGVALGSKSSLLVTAALGAEMLILSMTTAARLKREKKSILGMGALLASVIGGLVIGTFITNPSILTGLSAVASAAVIWIISEELKTPDSKIAAMLIFIGFGVMAFIPE